MRFKLFFFFLFIAFQSFTQLKFKFKQYMLHQTVFNPGYVDTESKYSFNSIYRRQWLRKESFPEAFVLYGHYNFDPNNGMGVVLTNDLLSNYNQFEISTNYVHNIKIGDDYNLGLGLRLGLIEQNYLSQKYTYFDPNEPVLATPNYTNRFLNIGTGVSFTSRELSLHVGLPQLRGNRFINQDDLYSFKNSQLYINAGYKFRQNDWFIVYPSLMIYATKGSATHASFFTNFLYGQLFWTGIGLDSDLTISGTIGLFTFSGFRIVYTIDNQFFYSDKSTGISHEVSVSYAKTIKHNAFTRRKTGGFRRGFRR